MLSFGKNGKSEIVGKTGTYLALHKSGEIFTVEASYSAVMLHNEWHAIAIVRNISDRQKSDEALRLSEEKYRTIFEHFQDLYYQADENGILTVVSPSLKAMGGYEPEELIGKSVADIYYSSEDRERFITEIQAKGEVNNYEMKLLAKNGQPKDMLVNARLIFDAEGSYSGSEGVLRDVTDRKKTEEALKKSEERRRTLLENIPVGIFRSLPDGKLVTVNKAMIDMHGYSSEEELREMNTTDLYSSSKS